MSKNIVLTSLVMSAGLMSIPTSSVAGADGRLPGSAEEYKYKDCAELQADIGRLTSRKVEDFEKAKMVRRNYKGGEYVIFCNGGTLTDSAGYNAAKRQQEYTVCNGYILYNWVPYTKNARHRSGVGKSNGEIPSVWAKQPPKPDYSKECKNKAVPV
jgi:hypothetical protein